MLRLMGAHRLCGMGTESRVIGIGFVGRKGLIGDGGEQPGARTAVGLPSCLEYNGMMCEVSVEASDEQFQSTEADARSNNENSTVTLEYMPLEFKDIRFGTGYGSNSAIIVLRSVIECMS